MPKRPTARERARAELTAEIKAEARRQLAVQGADGLSLRAIARELGIVSSGLFRYFANRDSLLTALIVEAYDALGARVEDAIAAKRPGDHLGRWRAGCHAIRDWATENPQEYALVFGSPIPGYEAPRDTVTPATRAPTALFRVLGDCRAAGQLRVTDERLPRPLGQDLRHLGELLDLRDVPAPTLAMAVAAYTQVFGMVTFELFGHFDNAVEERAALFEHTVHRLALVVGLPPKA